MWNELTFLWNELTIFWNDQTIDWNDLTMERNDRKCLTIAVTPAAIPCNSSTVAISRF